MKKLMLLFAITGCLIIHPGKTAQAQEGFIGEIRMFGGNFAPRGWAFCDGQLLPISSHNALFSILGTTYGGDGRTTFALPDLRGRVVIHPGNGPGLSNYQLGTKGGSETVTLQETQLPAHKHSVAAETGPAKKLLKAFAPKKTDSNAASTVQTPEPSDTIDTGNTGNGQPIDIRQPFTAINFIICTQGIYPSRN